MTRIGLKALVTITRVNSSVPHLTDGLGDPDPAFTKSRSKVRDPRRCLSDWTSSGR